MSICFNIFPHVNLLKRTSNIHLTYKVLHVQNKINTVTYYSTMLKYLSSLKMSRITKYGLVWTEGQNEIKLYSNFNTHFVYVYLEFFWATELSKLKLLEKFSIKLLGFIQI